MNNKKQNILGNPEFEALKDLPGIDANELMKQAGLVNDDGISSQNNADFNSQQNQSIAGNPQQVPSQKPASETSPSPEKKLDPEQQNLILKEIFGERFKTVDEVKQANIPAILDEVESLRRAKEELEQKLQSKPKHSFASDDIALYNEFVKETGIKDYGFFQRLNSVDLANMDHMDALVNQYILKNPNLIGKEAQVRKYFEKKYNIDPDQVSQEEIEVNRIGLISDGEKALQELKTLKEKLKLPEDLSQPTQPPSLSEKEKVALQQKWEPVKEKIAEVISKIPVPIKGSEKPIVNYVLSENEVNDIKKFIIDYAIENRMELNENNIKIIGNMVYGQAVLSKLPEIVHSVFEKARQMTEKEVHAFYTNPSPERNKDMPPSSKGQENSIEDKLFEAEMERY